MTKEEMAKTYVEGFPKGYQEVAYDAFLCGYGAKCTTETPNDLEEAAENYYEQDCPYPGEARVVNNEHDVWFPSQAIEEAFKAGAEWYREQILSGAIEADVNIYSDIVAGKHWAEFVVDMPINNLGDKARVIIVK